MLNWLLLLLFVPVGEGLFCNPEVNGLIKEGDGIVILRGLMRDDWLCMCGCCSWDCWFCWWLDVGKLFKDKLVACRFGATEDWVICVTAGVTLDAAAAAAAALITFGLFKGIDGGVLGII